MQRKDNEGELYGDYNHKKFKHLRYMDSDETFIQNVAKKDGTTSTRKQTKLKPVEIDFKDVYELDLDTLSPIAPVKGSGDYTAVEDYIIWFWSPILGGECLQVYTFLKSHAFGEKDYCYVSIRLIAKTIGRSENKIKEHLRILEHYGFIVMFNRKKKSNNAPTSPFFKIRKTPPILTEELYNMLDITVQEAHDDYMKKFKDVSFASEIQGSIPLIEEIVSKGIDMNEIYANQKKALVSSNRDRIKERVTVFDLEIGISILKQLDNILPPVAYKTCTTDSTIIVDSINKKLLFYTKDNSSLEVCQMVNLDMKIKDLLPNNLTGYEVALSSYEIEPD